MASLAGWYGRLNYPQSVLTDMADSMDGLNAVHEQHVTAEFAVRTTQPGLAGDIKRIAISEDGQTVVAFAGYLYTEDDSARRAPAEHCLRLYRQHGLEFPTRLNGTFAVVVADASTGQLHLVSDRLSTRPLYYAAENDGILFATEVKGILECPGQPREANLDTLVEFLSIQCLASDCTFYNGVLRLPAASVMTWGSGSVDIGQYWRPQFQYDRETTVKQSAERIAESIQAAVRRVCAGHERIGLMLSGGLDSRALAAASRVSVDSVTLHVAQCNETETAQRVAAVLHHRHEVHPVSSSYPLELLQEGSRIGDGMNAFHHAQPLYLHSFVVPRCHSVLLNGWMVLDAFGGAYLLPEERTSLIHRLAPPRLLREEQYEPVTAYVEKFRVASDSVLERLMGERATAVMGMVRDRLRSRAGTLASNCGSAHDLADVIIGEIGSLAQHRTHLHTRAIGRLTSEGVPGWDNDVVDALLHTPPEHRFNHTAYRHAIARLNGEAARIPYTATGAPASLGPWREHWQGALTRRTRALSLRLRQAVRPAVAPPPAGAWPDIGRAMTERPEWHTLLRGYVRSSRLVDMGLVNGDALREIVEAQISGTRYHVNLLGTWLTLEEWLEAYH